MANRNRKPSAARDSFHDAAVNVHENLCETFWLPKPIAGSDQVSEEKPTRIDMGSTSDARGVRNVSTIYMEDGSVFEVVVRKIV